MDDGRSPLSVQERGQLGGRVKSDLKKEAARLRWRQEKTAGVRRAVGRKPTRTLAERSSDGN
jgi:hypothetical protein